MPNDSKNVLWQTKQQIVNVDGTDYVVQTLTAKPENMSSNLMMTGNRSRDFPDKESKNAILRMLSQTYIEDKSKPLSGGLDL